ncbi:glycosyltransferase family 2 protein [Marinomonas primoryensis]|uniref:Glycosyltransferase family 2 protein n=1 Tax=Marinomonas primoryensis TaxID=178399 RepID=A0ABV0KYS0_9GAMM
MIQILLATYNGEKYLANLLDSLVAQTYQYWELLIHDDGSVDKTFDVLLSYQERYSDRIKILDDGIVMGNARDNFAHLLTISTADYVMFCDQDDVWLPEKIEKTFHKMQELEHCHGSLPILVHTDLMVVDESLVCIASSMFDYQGLNKSTKGLLQVLAKNSVTGCTMMVNRQAILVSTPILPSAIMHDWWMAANVVKVGGVVEFVDEALIHYRQHSVNSVGAKKQSFIGFFGIVFRHIFDRKMRNRTWLQAKSIDPTLNYFIFYREKFSITLKNLIKK